MTLVFEDSKGRLWFGGIGGLSLYAGGKLTNYTTKEGLVGNYVRSIYEDSEGTLWIGTYGEGLSRFKDGRFVNYRAENGLLQQRRVRHPGGRGAATSGSARTAASIASSGAS